MTNDEKFNEVTLARIKELKGTDTQEVFAKKIKTTQSSVSKMLKGEPISVATLKTLASVYKVSSDWLLGASNNKNINDKEDVDEMSYGEIFKVILLLLQKGALWEQSEGFFDGNNEFKELNNTQALIVNDKIIGAMINEWHRTKHVNEDTLSSWKEKRVKDYSSIPYINWNENTKVAYNEFFSKKAVKPESLVDFIEYIKESYSKKND